MNSSTRTLTFAGVAAVSALLAWGAWTASQPSIVPGFVGIGELFFPDFEDAAAATGLTVVDYDDDVKDAVEFSVKQNDKGVWTIPSHHNYPAEAKDRLAKTATSLMGVKKTAIQSRLKDDWKRFGVVDPQAEGLGTAEERGTRLTLNDGSDNPLVDLIIGNQVEGRSGHYFVREPEKDVTYVTELDVDLSAKFSEWIEPDLLKITTSDVSKVTLDNYSINESAGTVEGKEKLDFAKVDSKWTLEGLDDETEELDESPVTALVTNLDKLKIVGVRKKPEGLGDNLRIPPQFKQALQSQLDAEMSARGFFFGGDGQGGKRLYSNEGDMIAGLTNGVEYSLYFGEIARGTGKDIEVGLSKSEEAAADTEEDDADADADAESTEGDDEEEDGPRRYLFLKAGFNEALLGGKPVAPVEPVKPEILDEAAAEEAPAEEGKQEEAPAEEESEEEAIDTSEEDEDGGEIAADEDEPAPKAEEKKEAEETEAAQPEEKPAGDKEEAKTKESKPEPAKKKAKKAKPAPAKEAAPAKKEESAKEAPKTEAPAKDAKDEKDAKDKEPAEDDKPAEPEKTPKQIAQEEYDKAMGTYEVEKNAYETQLKAYEDKVTKGQEKADELAQRFAGWYYVISSDSFEKFRLTRTDVIKKKEVKADDAKTDDAAAADKK